MTTEAQPQGGLELPGLGGDFLVAVRNRLPERRRPPSRGPRPPDVAVVIVAKMLDLIGRQSQQAADLGIELARGFHLPVGARAEEQIAALQDTQSLEHPPQEILRQIGVRDEDRASEPGPARLQQREGGRHGDDGRGLDVHFHGCKPLGGDTALEAARDLGRDGREGDFALETAVTPQGQLALLAQLGVHLRGQIRHFQPSPHEQEEILRPDDRPGDDGVEDVECRNPGGRVKYRGHGIKQSARESFPIGSMRRTS